MSPVPTHARARIAATLAATALACAVLPVAVARAMAIVDPRAIADCDRAIEDQPRSLDAWGCYYEVARREGLWLEAESRLRGMLAVRPDDHHARYAIGLLLSYRPGGDPVGALEAAANGFEARDDDFAAFRALEALYRALVNLQQRDRAERTLERIGSIAERTLGDPRIDTRWSILQAGDALWSGAIAEADAHLSRALERAPEEALCARIENGLGRVAWARGRMPEAREHFARAADILRDLGDRWAEADERYNVALAAGRSVPTGEATVDDVSRRIAELLAVALASGNVGAEAQARLLTAQSESLSIDRRIDEADHALADLRMINKIEQRCFAMRLAANLRIARGRTGDRETAVALLDEAIALAGAHGSLPDEARTWIVRANLGGAFAAPERRTAMYRAVEVVEKIRDLSPDALVRGRYLWDWAHVYYRLVGSLLRDGDPIPPTEAEIDSAIRVLERLRSRHTLDTLDAAGATAHAYGTEDPESRRREGILREIGRVQSDLAREGATAAETDALVATLRRLEVEEAALREAIARENAPFARLRTIDPAGIPEIRTALREDEAVIAFQGSTRDADGTTKRWWNGGSWAIVITRDEARAVPLPDVDVVGTRTATLVGLARRDDPLIAEASTRLYRDLLADAVDRLPPGIRHLVLVPDGLLHRVPFELLRAAPTEPTLAERFTVVEAPSATAWVRWRARPAVVQPGVLGFADPVPAGDARAVERSGARPAGRLPAARDEAREVAAALGGSSRVRIGPQATESALKSGLPFGGAVVHVAAHAVVDDRDPARTAVLLAPGGHDDGLVQLREIVALRLADKIVLLSACSGADGEVAHGEGVVGLTHGLFQAGARAVVAGRWPVRDDDARKTMVSLAARLATGETLAVALAEVRRGMIDAGDPPSAWAGWVVHGDGDARAVASSPASSAPSGRTATWVTLGALCALAAGLGLRLRRA